MKVPFKIFVWSVSVYALLTLPVIVFPFMYMISIFYVMTFGWFAWAAFTVAYLIIGSYRILFQTKMILLTLAIPVSVSFAFQMIQAFKVEKDVWNSGAFLLFPLTGVLSGWICLYVVRKQIMVENLVLTSVHENKI